MRRATAWGACAPPTDGEEGSAAVVAIGVVVGTILVTTAVLGGCAGVVGHQRAVAAADAAALAAADVASGLVPGEPCSAAAKVARADDADVSSCVIEEREVTVSVEVGVGPLVLAARSRAGPPP
ncbi:MULTISPECIES: Rv3654c family TadE-like protein [unclassified Rathayibacter]|uniref:Rv3654c family TadE-like protein n=1 Tax=unclassified Rathayibacter TaxID=2609250 RepID=UPI00188AB025|nr:MULTISPECIES: Rv3654c family TadE-like protein [unclassified Rathayibacter]MBF4462861.1 helicase [Rathayibacter sp. VKM Ac-2879]MBF4504275.1 helicase [Rathayibacter sp. VKM Ac-2878]